MLSNARRAFVACEPARPQGLGRKAGARPGSFAAVGNPPAFA
jgi:hypothetical protein